MIVIMIFIPKEKYILGHGVSTYPSVLILRFTSSQESNNVAVQSDTRGGFFQRSLRKKSQARNGKIKGGITLILNIYR